MYLLQLKYTMTFHAAVPLYMLFLLPIMLPSYRLIHKIYSRAAQRQAGKLDRGQIMKGCEYHIQVCEFSPAE